MNELINILGFILIIPILISIFMLLNEDSETQLITAFTSILIGGIIFQFFGHNIFSTSLIIGGIIIGIIGVKKILSKVRF